MVVFLVASGAKEADVIVNGHVAHVRFTSLFRSFFADVRLNITKYLRDGINTFSIQNIFPSKTYIDAYIPFPSLQYGDAKSIGISPELLNKVDELITKEVKEGFPGATLVIAKNGKIIKEQAYGYARKYDDNGKLMDKYQEMQKDTLFDLASITKIFSTLFGIMKLHSDRVLKYLNTVNQYMPEYKGIEVHDRTEVRIFDILTHSAGYIESYYFYDDKKPFYSRDKKLTKELICSKVPLTGDKGGVPKYNDVNYILGGLLIEHISSMDLNEYAKRFFYGPLGLRRTTFAPLKYGFYKEDIAATEVTGNTRNKTVDFKDIRKTVIQGEVQDENAFYSMNEVAGHAGLFSTAKELAILSQVILNQGGYEDNKFWSKDTQDLFVKPYDKAITYGIGWRRQGNEDRKTHFGAYASSQAIGHLGSTGTGFVIDPAHDLIIVLLTNKQHSPYINKKYEGDNYQTAKQGSIMQLIYESFLNA
jgi:N-acetylmuramoyl-L-alanine amidase